MLIFPGTQNQIAATNAQAGAENQVGAAKNNSGKHGGRDLAVTGPSAPAQIAAPLILPRATVTAKALGGSLFASLHGAPPKPPRANAIAAGQPQETTAPTQAAVEERTESVTENPQSAKHSRGIRHFIKKRARAIAADVKEQVRSLKTNARSKKAKAKRVFLDPRLISNPAYEPVKNRRPAGNPDISLKLQNLGNMLASKLDEFKTGTEPAGSETKQSSRGIASWVASSSKPSVKTFAKKIMGRERSYDLTASTPEKKSSSALAGNVQDTAKDNKAAQKAEARVQLVGNFDVPNKHP